MAVAARVDAAAGSLAAILLDTLYDLRDIRSVLKDTGSFQPDAATILQRTEGTLRSKAQQLTGAGIHRIAAFFGTVRSSRMASLCSAFQPLRAEPPSRRRSAAGTTGGGGEPLCGGQRQPTHGMDEPAPLLRASRPHRQAGRPRRVEEAHDAALLLGGAAATLATWRAAPRAGARDAGLLPTAVRGLPIVRRPGPTSTSATECRCHPPRSRVPWR